MDHSPGMKNALMAVSVTLWLYKQERTIEPSSSRLKHDKVGIFERTSRVG
jgi:hypothetical protein